MAPEFPAGTVLVQDPIVSNLNVGDVVLVREPKDQVALLALRIAALPGSRIEYVDGSILVNGSRLKGAKHPMVGPPFPWLGLEPILALRGAYRVPTDSYFELADSPDDAIDSRFFGPVPRALILGHVRKWAELSKDRLAARPYIERNINALLPRLPLKLQDGLSLVSVSANPDNEVILGIRLDGEYKGKIPLPKGELDDLKESLLVFYCQPTLGMHTAGISARYVLSDLTRQLASIAFSSAACQSR